MTLSHSRDSESEHQINQGLHTIMLHTKDKVRATDRSSDLNSGLFDNTYVCRAITLTKNASMLFLTPHSFYSDKERG